VGHGIRHQIVNASLLRYIYVMYAGKVVEKGLVKQVLYNPQHPYTRLLLRAVPNPLKKIKKLEYIPGAVPLLTNPPPSCRFHPRYPFVMDICGRQEPQMIEVEKDHCASCWLHIKKQ